MRQCPECLEAPMPLLVLESEGKRQYACRNCGYTEISFEVPERYLRELVMNSLKLASLVRLPGA